MSAHTAAMHHDMLHTTPQMQAGHHPSSGRPSSAHIKHESHIKTESHTKHELSSPELEQASRGRRRSRDEAGEGGEGGEGSSGDGEGGADGPRKRRRSRKGLDKKFDCPHEKCGKSYSRAEHLYRHQLNHNPKQIYNCEFPGCHRYFVRQDLCARHMERHTAKGSQLQRKDAFLHNVSPTGPPRSASEMSQDASQFGGSPVMQGFPSSDAGMPGNGSPGPRSMYPSSPEHTMTTISPISTAATMNMGFSTASRGGTGAGRGSRGGVPVGTSNGTGNPTPPGLNRTESGRSIRWEDTVAGRGEHSAMSAGAPIATFHDGQRHASFGTSDAMLQDHNIPINRVYAMAPSSKAAGPATPSLGSLSISTMNQPNSSLQQHQHQHVTGYSDGRTPSLASFPGSPRAFMPQQNVATFSLPPPEYNTPVQTAVSGSPGMDFTTASPQMIATIAQSSLADANPFDSTSMTYTFPMFGEGAVGDDSSTRSPYAITDNFATWLFNSGYAGSDMAGFAEGMGGFQAPYLGQDLSMNGLYPQQPIPPHRPMAVTSILDTRPESVLSEAKRQELVDVIVNQFNENENAPVIKQKEQLLDGNREDDQHVLSLRMMQRYIMSYWDHFHPQLPILHRPSFAADKTPSVLLLAMMMIGATCLERVPPSSQDVSQAAAQLSQFLAWHLRWAIFSDGAFRPPAKLWIFQALLLLEIYEKMYSTRALHERAHIHHATTITLMRRGSSLIGRSPLDSPPSVKDNQVGQGDGAGGGGANNSGSNTPERWWQRWITSEATRRCAFAAFVIDSIHATMFGHSAVMVAHEMRLPLPCDERAWAANDSAEVGRIEASLQADGIKPVTFLEGLKSTLGGQNVRTNSFGRTVLMAGLLSVSYHMHQRDLQVHSLGVSQAVGGREKWRVALLKAFDVWQHHYDSSLADSDMSSGPYHYSKQLEADIVFESRTVLHHLAHMAMHVDIVDCQIFAGASRLLGRSIGSQDFKSACRRMKEWAPRAQARDATFYSLRFLSEVLLPRHPPHAAPSLSEYSARDDCLLNRPWVMYFAALIVWSYGFALEGPISQTTTLLSSPADRHADMRHFLLRVGGVNTPDDLRDIEGRNRCAGMLMVLRDSFLCTRWELLHEAGNLLGRCLEKLLGNPA